MELNLSNIDTGKAIAVVLLGSVAAAFLVYAFDVFLAPHLVLPSSSANPAGGGTNTGLAISGGAAVLAA